MSKFLTIIHISLICILIYYYVSKVSSCFFFNLKYHFPPRFLFFNLREGRGQVVEGDIGHCMFVFVVCIFFIYCFVFSQSPWRSRPGCRRWCRPLPTSASSFHSDRLTDLTWNLYTTKVPSLLCFASWRSGIINSVLFCFVDVCVDTQWADNVNDDCYNCCLSWSINARHLACLFLFLSALAALYLHI